MSSTQTDPLSDLFCIAETIENGRIMVTASPELWVNDDILFWPPGGNVDRSVPIHPQPDWSPIMCKILKSSIATFEEALMLEKMYSKHRNSDSFRQDQARKQLKRKHPVNENEYAKSNLIDMNSLVNEINNKPASEPKRVEFKMKGNKFHSLCQKNTKLIQAEPNKVKSAIPVRPPWSNVGLKSKNSQLEKGGVVNVAKKPRYINYLKSGNSSNATAFGKKKIPPPPLLKMKKPQASSTITKEQYLRENAHTENAANCEHAQVGTGLFAKKILKPSTKSVTGVTVIDDTVIKPADLMNTPPMLGNDQTNGNVLSAVLSGMNDMQNFFKQTEERRIKFEARMQTQWETFVKKMMLTQGQSEGFGESLNDDVNDDFDDLDENFPIKLQANVEELDWCNDKDVAFKRRLKTRLDLFGGKDAKQAIRLKMKYLIADTALEHYTWRGTADKKAFNKLTHLNDLIFKSVRTQFRNYTVKQYKTYLVEWVKHAKTRQRKVIYQYPNREKRWDDGEEDGDEEFGP